MVCFQLPLLKVANTTPVAALFGMATLMVLLPLINACFCVANNLPVLSINWISMVLFFSVLISAATVLLRVVIVGYTLINCVSEAANLTFTVFESLREPSFYHRAHGGAEGYARHGIRNGRAVPRVQLCADDSRSHAGMF